MGLDAFVCHKLTSLIARIIFFLKTSLVTFILKGLIMSLFILTDLSKLLLHVMENASLIPLL